MSLCSTIVIRQTVFYTPSTLTVSESQAITGTLSCSPNVKNNRDLDIAIRYKVGEEKEHEMFYKMCVPFTFFQECLRESTVSSIHGHC
jgi:hypothetical protein